MALELGIFIYVLLNISLKRGVIMEKETFKKAQLIASQKTWALYLLLAAIFISGGLLAWHYDWSKFRSTIENSNIDLNYENPGAKCPKTSADTSSPCCTATEGVMQATVDAIYVSASCKCPSDTKFKEMAPEGGGTLYMICKCYPCPGEE